MLSYDLASHSVILQEFANLVRIPCSKEHFITFLSELLDNRTEERHMRGIVQVDPDLLLDGWGKCFRNFGDSHAGIRHHLFLIAWSLRAWSAGWHSTARNGSV